MANLKYYLLAVLLIGALVVLRIRDHRAADSNRSEVASSTTAGGWNDSSATLQPDWEHESHWLVDEVVRDIAEMLALTKQGAAGLDDLKVETRPQADSTTRFTFQAGGKGLKRVEGEIELKNHLWSVEHFGPFASQLVSAWDISPGAAPEKPSLLPELLTDPDTSMLIREGARVSKDLNASPNRAASHEEAALLMTMLAHREAAGPLSDSRPALCRAAAHLALAEAFRGSAAPGTCRVLSEALMAACMGREADALARADQLPEELAAWQRAIRMRANGDYRLLPNPVAATRLEQISYARAAAESAGNHLLAEFVQTEYVPKIADWHRIGLSEPFSVQEGHLFASDSVQAELTSSAAAFRAIHLEEPKSLDALVQALNTPRQRAVLRDDEAPRIQVLGWSDWAAFQQRHLMNALSATDYFFEKLWGVHDAVAELHQVATQQLKDLDLFWKYLGFGYDETETQERENAFVEKISRHPEWETAGHWAQMLRYSHNQGRRFRMPAASRWFRGGWIFGTTMEYVDRAVTLSSMPDFGATQPAALAALAPSHYRILLSTADNSGLPRQEAYEKYFAKIADYQIRPARLLAEQVKHDPVAYAEAMERVAKIDADTWIDLAKHFAETGREKEAADAFAQGFLKAHDRVRVANNSAWPAQYYLDKGDQSSALEIAEDAAETYSNVGLQTAVHVMVALEKWDKALEYASGMAERYGDTGGLMMLLANHHDKDPRLAKAYQQLQAALFPNRMKKVTLEDFKDAAVSGVEITSTSYELNRHSIREGEVIVALDGIQVENQQQYFAVRGMKPDAPLQLILWNGSEYREIEASVPDRRFGCDLGDYQR